MGAFAKIIPNPGKFKFNLLSDKNRSNEFT